MPRNDNRDEADTSLLARNARVAEAALRLLAQMAAQTQDATAVKLAKAAAVGRATLYRSHRSVVGPFAAIADALREKMPTSTYEELAERLRDVTSELVAQKRLAEGAAQQLNHVTLRLKDTERRLRIAEDRLEGHGLSIEKVISLRGRRRTPRPSL